MPLALANELHQLQPVDVGHVDVGDHEIVAATRQQAERVEAADQLRRPRAPRIRSHPPERSVRTPGGERIVYDQNARHGGPGLRARERGVAGNRPPEFIASRASSEFGVAGRRLVTLTLPDTVRARFSCSEVLAEADHDHHERPRNGRSGAAGAGWLKYARVARRFGHRNPKQDPQMHEAPAFRQGLRFSSTKPQAAPFNRLGRPLSEGDLTAVSLSGVLYERELADEAERTSAILVSPLAVLEHGAVAVVEAPAERHAAIFLSGGRRLDVEVVRLTRGPLTLDRARDQAASLTPRPVSFRIRLRGVVVVQTDPVAR